jgi:nicotinamidase-related amidase
MSSTTSVGRSALMLMDLQAGIVGRIDDPEGLVARVAAARDAARGLGMLIVHVDVAFRPGYPEVNTANKLFAGVPASGAMLQGSPEAQRPEPLRAREDEVTVVKHRVGAFHATPLDMILRANGVSRLVLSGISTSGVVLTTTRWASDLDYELTVCSDLCADFDDEVHKVLLEKVLPMQATVTDSVEIFGG